jgi:hypothetical protein
MPNFAHTQGTAAARGVMQLKHYDVDAILCLSWKLRGIYSTEAFRSVPSNARFQYEGHEEKQKVLRRNNHVLFFDTRIAYKMTRPIIVLFLPVLMFQQT